MSDWKVMNMPLYRRLILVPALTFWVAAASAASYTFTTVLVPPSTTTTVGSGGRVSPIPYGMNSSDQIISNVLTYQSVGQFNQYSSAYLYSDGVFAALKDPAYPGQTLAYAINDLGQIVGASGYPAFGSAPVMVNAEVGFVYSGGTFAHFSNPLLTQTVFTGINNSGQIVGYGPDKSGQTQGFLFSGGIFTPLGNAPDGKPFVPVAINDAGLILGHDQQLRSTSYLYDHGVFNPVVFPGATTTALSLNNAGQIAGYYRQQPSDSAAVGFVYTSGGFTTVTYPSESVPKQSIYAINNLGQILIYGPGIPQSVSTPYGAEQFAIGTPVADTPEPSSLALTLGGILSLSGLLWGAKQAGGPPRSSKSPLVN